MIKHDLDTEIWHDQIAMQRMRLLDYQRDNIQSEMTIKSNTRKVESANHMTWSMRWWECHRKTSQAHSQKRSPNQTWHSIDTDLISPHRNVISIYASPWRPLGAYWNCSWQPHRMQWAERESQPILYKQQGLFRVMLFWGVILWPRVAVDKSKKGIPSVHCGASQGKSYRFRSTNSD